MSYMAAGHLPGEGPYGTQIERGIRWVLEHQEDNGMLVHKRSHGPMYSHGISTLMLAEALGMVDEADAALKAVTLRRTQDLAREGVVSADELDRAASEDRQARAQVDLDRAAVGSAEAGLREAEVNLAYTDITSPVEGVVVSRNVDVGQTVAASFQTPTLFLVAGDLTAMQVAEILRRSARDIGQPGRDNASGFGELDVAAALALAAPVDDPFEPNDACNAAVAAASLACSSDKSASRSERTPGAMPPAASVGNEDPSMGREHRMSDAQIMSVISAANTKMPTIA